MPYSGFGGYIIDKTNPVAKGKNVTVQLGADGKAEISVSLINNGSYDNSESELKYDLSKKIFTSTDLGKNQVSFIVTDQAGNSNEVSVTVTVEKNIQSIAAASVVEMTYGENLLLPKKVEVTYSDVSKDSLPVEWDIASYTGNAGDYNFKGSVNNPEYTTNSELLKAKVTVKVNKRNLTAELTGDVAKTYDGKTSATLTSENYTSNKLEGDEVSFTGEASYENKNAGVAEKVTVNNLVLSGEDAANYKLTYRNSKCAHRKNICPHIKGKSARYN